MRMSDVERYAKLNKKGNGMFTDQIRQFFCGLHGHDALLHVEDNRISLLCTSCGHETPGWEFGRRAARSERAASQSTVSLPLVGQRRVA
jgi:hypothetical protein